MSDNKKITKDFLDSILDFTEQAYLKTFMENDIMKQAVKKVVLAGIYYNGVLEAGKEPEPARNFLLGTTDGFIQLSDEALGQKLRAGSTAVGLLENGFQSLELYKEVEKANKEKVNIAR